MGELADRRWPRLDTGALSAWAMALAWALFVWGLGSEGFSDDNTSSFLDPLLAWLFSGLGGLSEAARESLHWWIRKIAHPVEYGLWAALLLRAFWRSHLRDTIPLAAATLGLVLALAAADEVRQGNSATRDGSAWDALLDLAGGMMAVTFVLGSPQALRGWWLGSPESAPSRAPMSETQRRTETSHE